ncbi:hypothetical protein [Flavobacterium sp.]|uniref:hypothetical protein n=1 Tax=Flavobacterium sp. TaxID=239 RepID=UPI0038D097D7
MENSNQQNLELIAQTIKTAQRRFYDDSPYYILWGSAVFLASVLQYFLILAQSEYNPIGWAVLIPAALIIQFIYTRNQKKKIQIKTHVESLLNTMWTAFGITLMIVLFFSNKLGLNTYPVILCLYAISTFISGSAFKIKAFVLGSILCWIFAIVCFFVDFQTQLLLLSAGVLVAFLIPGIVLRANEKAEEN